jgi:hypothetical protein
MATSRSEPAEMGWWTGLNASSTCITLCPIHSCVSALTALNLGFCISCAWAGHCTGYLVEKIQLLHSIRNGHNTAGDGICQLSKMCEYHESVQLNWSQQLSCSFGEFLMYFTRTWCFLLWYNFAWGSFLCFFYPPDLSDTEKKDKMCSPEIIYRAYAILFLTVGPFWLPGSITAQNCSVMYHAAVTLYVLTNGAMSFEPAAVLFLVYSHRGGGKGDLGVHLWIN